MGSSRKYQVDRDRDSIEGKNNKLWVIAGITICGPLRSISTKRGNGEGDGDDEGSTTPTAKESRLPEKFACPPPPPRKLRPRSSCRNDGNIEYFTSPELDSFFEQFGDGERVRSRS